MITMTEINGTIYKITNPKGRVYIGQTTRPIEFRWGQYQRMDCKGQTKLYRSFQKYGVENHIFEVIITGIKTKEILNALEILYIATFDSAGENGLNCTIGGEGNLIPEEKLKYGIRSGDEGYNKIQGKVYYETHKEEKKAHDKAYYEAHKEEKKATNKAYYEAHKEEQKARFKAWREAHKEEMKATNKAYYEAHKEEMKARFKAYYEAHKEELKAKKKAYKVREKEIAKHFGYKIFHWNALPSDMRAQMRAQYDALQGA